MPAPIISTPELYAPDQSSMSVSLKHYIPGLDGVRAFAVLLVYIQHLATPGSLVGSLGVDVFFCLSGFLIIGILHSQRMQIESGRSKPWQELKTFWKKRARRIFPLYYGTVGFLIIAAVWQGNSVYADGLVPWYLITRVRHFPAVFQSLP